LSRLFLIVLLILLPALAAGARGEFRLRDGQRVVFLGDSITNAGMYVQYLDAYLTTRFPDRKVELINLGLSSETVTGLSEPDHPWPRPDVHERLERVLQKAKPDLVVACYGMNDGIYYPFDAGRLARYREAIRRLVDRVQGAGAKVELVTPPPFDPLPVRSRVLPAGAPKYSWMAPYAGYDDVLGRYGEWLLTLRPDGIPTADPHGAVSRYLTAVRRSDPDHHVAGDGVHLDATGHWLIAAEILKAWNAPAEVDGAVIDAPRLKARAGEISDLSRDGDGLRLTWLTRIPMPLDPRWDPRVAELEQISERFNRHRLTVAGLPHERYLLFEGSTQVGEASRAELAAGLDLLRYPDLSTNRSSARVLTLVRQRERLLSPAWLTDVGHKRPDTPKGLPLDEARRQAGELARQIRELARPRTLTLRLVPVRS
jgi:lysophospholipase L1-like esterase